MTRFLMCNLLALLFVSSVNADFIQILKSERAVTAAEMGGGAPGGTVYEFFVTTDDDILAINFVTTRSTRPFYQNAFGSNSDEPNPALIPVFPALSADTWITTPGATSVLGGGFPNDGNDTYGDTSNNGPQNNFKFASLTVPYGGLFHFSGQLDIRGSSGVYSQEFWYPYFPEPSSLTLVAGMLCGLIFRRPTY